MEARANLHRRHSKAALEGDREARLNAVDSDCDQPAELTR